MLMILKIWINMNRFLNVLLAIFLMVLFSVPLICISISVLITSKGSVLYYSKRIGKNGAVFFMPKFRSMVPDAPVIATHLLASPDKYLTSVGRFLRKTSLDELPQLLSVLKGEMNFVGPRPALFNQIDLISLRDEKGVNKLTPGITGWAQVNGRDELSIPEKVSLDVEYIQKQSLFFDLKIMWKTVLKVIKRDKISY